MKTKLLALLTLIILIGGTGCVGNGGGFGHGGHGFGHGPGHYHQSWR